MARKAGGREMKKIERLTAISITYDETTGKSMDAVIIKESALNEQEAHIEQLEREKEEAVDALTWYCSSCPEMEDSKWTNNLYFKYQSLIKKLTGETWQELKEERG